MLHGFEKHCLPKGSSADQELWDKTHDDSVRRFKWAKNNKENENVGIRANAFHILSTYYRYGWLVNEDAQLADQYLKDSANLGHARACYDLARRCLEAKDKDLALLYIKKGIENIDESGFDCVETSHNQKSMKNDLEGLQLVCNFSGKAKFGS